jgi:FkbM family methyltransferase
MSAFESTAIAPAGAGAVATPSARATPEAIRKAELELAMLAAPDDAAQRASYFDFLIRLASGRTGLLCANLPDLATPLYFRAGTPDILVMAQSFRDDAYALDIKATPQRILMIGGYAGYVPVDLARRFPRAQVLCVEPLAENFRLLSLNTTPWRRIRVAQAAVWHSNARLAPLGRVQGDWAVRLTDEALLEDRVIPALTVRDLLARAGWHHAEMIVCDACGAEREIFADPLAPWLRHVDVALVRMYESSSPGAMASVRACFDDEHFEQRRHGEMELFTRRVPLMAMPPTPYDAFVVRGEPGTTPFQLRDVAGTGWAFFIFDGTNCQLHPNAPGQRPASAIFPVQLAGHSRMVSRIHHAGVTGAGQIRFLATVVRADGTELGRGEALLEARATGQVTVALPRESGAAFVVLQTEMAPGVPHNNMAWARWLEPKIA